MRTRFITAVLVALVLNALVTPRSSAATGSADDDAAADATLRRGKAYYHLMEAHLAARRGSYLQVLRELRDATALEPDAADLHAEAGALLHRLGQRNEAEKMARRALEIEPDHKGAIHVMADLTAARATATGDERGLEEAMRLYEKLIDEPVVDDEVLLILARLRLQSGDPSAAVKPARRLAAQRPGDPLPVRLLVRSLTQADRPGEALDALLEFVVKNPDEDELLRDVEDLAFRTRNWDRVERSFATIVEARPDLATARKIRGEALVFLRRPREAVPELKKAIELDPGNPYVRLHLTRAYRLGGRLADAARLARQLSEEYPDSVLTHAELGEALVLRGDVDGAIVAFRDALDILSADPTTEPGQRDEARLRMAGMLLEADRPEEAFAVLEDLASTDGTEPTELRARVAIRMGDLKRARTLARGLRAAGAEGAADLVEGEVFLVEGDVAKGVSRLERSIATLGRSARLWAGRLLQRAGYAKEEERVLRDWIESEGVDPEARFALGSFLDRSGRHDEAEQEFRRALELDPRYALALNHLGYSLAERSERLTEALDLVTRALDVDPWNGAYLDSLGWIYFRLGRYQEAREPLEQAAREYPHDPVVLEHLGDVYGELGEYDAAVATWRQAIDAGAADPENLRRKLEGVAAAKRALESGEDTARKSPSVSQTPIPPSPR